MTAEHRAARNESDEQRWRLSWLLHACMKDAAANGEWRMANGEWRMANGSAYDQKRSCGGGRDRKFRAVKIVSQVVRRTLHESHGSPMKKTLPLCTLVLLFALSGQAIAGANTAQLNCTGSHAGQALTLVGDVPASIVEVDLKLSFRGQTIRLASPQAETCESTDFRRGIYRVEAGLSGSNRLQLQAKPKSIKYKGSMGGGKLNANFGAILKDAPEPFRSALKGAELSCTYAYEI